MHDDGDGYAVLKQRGRTGKKTPGYSWCRACGTTWDRVEGHSTWYDPLPPLNITWVGPDGVSHVGTTGNKGCFPLCEECWAERTPVERMPFYAELVQAWERTHEVHPGTVEAIGAAVMAGG